MAYSTLQQWLIHASVLGFTPVSHHIRAQRNVVVNCDIIASYPAVRDCLDNVYSGMAFTSPLQFNYNRVDVRSG